MYLFLVNFCFVALHIGSISVEAAASLDDGESLFDYRNLLLFGMPASCAGKNFCFDKGDKYPDRKIEEILNRFSLLPFNDRIETSFTFRDNSEINNPDCPTNDEFVDKPIYYIRDENDKVRAVVQSKEKFQQIYSTKWCQRPGPISYDTPHFLKGSRTLHKFGVECANTYMDFDFFVLTIDGKIEIARPKGGIPVCCRCRYSNPSAK